ncbi:PiggyBac transposable element-derived protein 3 [Eumeta japonica]|uniref:PiggyBac transposable element-derived protein 3 n=1 Tax=Eumeta variegata TaxID=151549 RepID=A0A4C1SWI0_EUMVA|nr:PiggyBac transposable element-derived protein 3 [Eumeta japonica]
MDPRREFFDFDQYRGTGTLNDLLDILFEDEEEAGDLPIPESIYVAPLDPSVLTDEDSGDEDSGGNTENLNARQLTAQAETTGIRCYRNGTRKPPAEMQKLTSNKIMKKKQRGYHESAISNEDRVIVAKWMDNSIVSIALNNLGVQPLSMVKRYSQKDKATTQVPRPYILGEYNKYMGGVDRMDENVNMYRIHIRGKKWYWSLITWMLDTCVHNAWQLHKKNDKIPQLEFRKEIVLTYLKSYGIAAKGGARPSTFKLADTERFDGLNH